MPLFDTYFLVGPLILVVNPSGKSQSPKKVRDLNLVFTVSADALALNDAGASADTALTAKLDIVSASFLVLSMTPNYLYEPNNPCIQNGGRDLGTNLLEQVSRFRGGNDWNVAGPVRTSVNMVLKKTIQVQVISLWRINSSFRRRSDKNVWKWEGQIQIQLAEHGLTLVQCRCVGIGFEVCHQCPLLLTWLDFNPSMDT